MSLKLSKVTKRENIKKKADAVIKAYSSSLSSKCDPLGSYTGTPYKNCDKPVQDADDL